MKKKDKGVVQVIYGELQLGNSCSLRKNTCTCSVSLIWPQCKAVKGSWRSELSQPNDVTLWSVTAVGVYAVCVNYSIVLDVLALDSE